MKVKIMTLTLKEKAMVTQHLNNLPPFDLAFSGMKNLTKAQLLAKLQNAVVEVRDRMLKDIQKDHPHPIPYDINSGHCIALAYFVNELCPYAKPLCMNTIPTYERFEHWVLEYDGKYYDAEHVDGCDMEELVRAYEAPRPQTPVW